MTVQPLKNEQAVVQMVSKPTTSDQTSHLAKQSLHTRPVTDRLQNNVAPHETFSGAVVAPAKDAATRLVTISNVNAARSVQGVAVQAASAVNVQMDAIKEAMTHIVKDYPPFALGDEKRQQYLMSISGIRRQIEAMMVPPVTSTPATAQIGSKDIWGDLFKGVSIPMLTVSGPNEATDAQVQAALTSVTSMQTTLSERSDSLAQQTATTLTPTASLMAESISQTVSQGLAASGMSLTNNLSGVLRSL
jgi:hypothetical protein